MATQQMNMDTISNNLANANTTGYKRSRADFEDLMYQNLVPAGSQTSNNTNIPGGIQLGMGSKTSSVNKIFQQGSFTQTDNNLDLAIEGNGFFKILRGSQEVYTRAGNFKIDQNGNVVDASGNQLQPQISIPQTAVSMNIDSGGTFTAMDATGKVLTTVNMKLYTFPNPAGLTALGQNYFQPTPSSGDATEQAPGVDSAGTILQGFLEASNINVVEEMVNMILCQRAYEANSKVIKSSDEMLHEANNVKS
jgi:flagellar basal-body rod protein FlgG